jgi:ADP-dependent NAD(P)H-hydrate dehydratase / NAD(P)H-hydrate epimerase
MSEPVYMPLYTAAQVRELDRAAIGDAGIAGYELMCRAGAALAHCVARRWPQARRVRVLCGPGNNGGDGYVLARLLRDSGVDVRVLWVSDPARLRGDAATAAADYRNGGGVAETFDGTLPADIELCVDAMLGTGLDRPVEGLCRQAIETLNLQPSPVLAVDIPSGLHADSGAVLGAAVQARCTVTFIGRKRGLYTAAGAQFAGDIEFDSLAVPAAVYATQTAGTLLIERPPLGSLSGRRRRDTHKGDFGHVLIVGGDTGMAGAARLAAEAAARCGAGLVSVATRAAHAACLNAGRPELMVHGVEQSADLDALLARASVVVAGPGLGRTSWSQRLFERVLDSRLPVVVDADALNLLAIDPRARENWILTPHPGEAARLLGVAAADIQRDRFGAVRQLVDRYGGVAVLKGAGSLIAAAGLPLRLCALGNPGMASGGMGDVLGGLLGGLLAQGLAGLDAASAAVWLHAKAADLAALEHGERGLLASDLLPPLRGLLNGGV